MMENSSNVSTSFVLLGLVEMEGFWYLYCLVCLVTYTFIMVLSAIIVLVVVTEESLHEPMYLLICTLVLNGILGSSTFFPKLIIDLLSSSKTISRAPCLGQAFCVLFFAFFEICTFTLMAYDRYVAVCYPLQYVLIMTIEKTLRFIVASFTFTFTANLVAIVLSARLPLCGSQIRNIFCDNMSFFILSCVNTSINNIYGATVFMMFLVFTLLVIAYSYIRIFLICMKISQHAYEKAIHTLVTHLVNFSIFLIGVLFIFIRYRLGNVDLPLGVQILLSATCLVVPPLLNPFIYGIRTKALTMKISRFLNK
uniref:G-protein coupled receptors family 1 profile domain-containing protein n=1 Tax=Xenopus tropicalis TaxID=8364 RepID=A0A1B8Y8S4_XENTR|eukprot:XP_002942371.2 PREDICTED: olfactory receptor 52D1-like [Xenopus tropicalis]